MKKKILADFYLIETDYLQNKSITVTTTDFKRLKALPVVSGFPVLPSKDKEGNN